MPDRDRQMHCEGVPAVEWLAFCYVAGELSADEAAEFEACLRDEQPAREALARAAELYWAVQAAYCDAAVGITGSAGQAAGIPADAPGPASACGGAGMVSQPAAGAASAAARRPLRRRGLSWVRMACGAALTAAVAVLVFVVAPWRAGDKPVVADNGADDPALALAWVAARDLHVPPLSVDAARPDDPLVGGLLDDVHDLPEPATAEPELVVPRWMLAAVAADEMPAP